jgi:hypothetical protein
MYPRDQQFCPFLCLWSDEISKHVIHWLPDNSLTDVGKRSKKSDHDMMWLHVNCWSTGKEVSDLFPDSFLKIAIRLIRHCDMVSPGLFWKGSNCSFAPFAHFILNCPPLEWACGTYKRAMSVRCMQPFRNQVAIQYALQAPCSVD